MEGLLKLDLTRPATWFSPKANCGNDRNVLCTAHLATFTTGFGESEISRDLLRFEEDDDDVGIACTSLSGFLLPTPGERERRLNDFFHDRRVTTKHTTRRHRRRLKDTVLAHAEDELPRRCTCRPQLRRPNLSTPVPVTGIRRAEGAWEELRRFDAGLCR